MGRAPAGTAGGTWPLVGREEEVRELADALLGPESAAVVLAGPAGVGKTRLARELLSRAAAAGQLTEWTAATAADATVPFAPLIHLLQSVDITGSDMLGMLHRLGRLLARRSGEAPLVLVVDDAHLLDESSATLLYHLTSGQHLSLLATIRSGEREPEPLLSLWKDGMAVRREVGALAEGDVVELLPQVLGGQVDGRAAKTLWAVSAGNMLHLRQLVEGGLSSGSLWRRDGVWTWRGPLVAPGLTELLQHRVSGLAPLEREALEIVALAEPVDLSVLARLAGELALQRLEEQQLIELTCDDRRTVVRASHPLFTELLRTTLPRLRVRSIYGQLADAMDATGGRRRTDVLRVATWHLEAGHPTEPGRLVDAAQGALAHLDALLAERLAAAAVNAGGGVPAVMALASALDAQGRRVEADALFARAQKDARTDDERFEVATRRGPALFFGLGRAAEAEAVLWQAENIIADSDRRDLLGALRAQVLLFSGRTEAALEVGDAIVARSRPRGPHYVQALASVAPALALRGRTTEARQRIEQGSAAALELAQAMPHAVAWLFGARIVADCLSGDLADARSAAETLYDLSLAARDDGLRAGTAAALGRVALAEGQASTAARWFREAAALLRVYDPSGYLPWCLGGLSHASALVGEIEQARDALSESEERGMAASRAFGVEVALARAWLAAAEGVTSSAMTVALEAAELAAELGQTAMECLALHDAVRLGAGAEVVERLTTISQAVDGPFLAICAAHAQAKLSGDGDGLDRVAAAFSELGARLLAAEASAEAVVAHREAKKLSSAASSRARSHAARALCEGARTPVLALADQAGPDPLTSREREVAMLAANGLTSRKIAERLVVSIRTVDNHLYKVYAKLGVSSREQLSDVLAGASSTTPRGASRTI